MTLGDLQERLCRARGLAPTLLPLLYGALPNAKSCCKLCLGEAALQPHANHARLRLQSRVLASARLYLAYAL